MGVGGRLGEKLSRRMTFKGILGVSRGPIQVHSLLPEGS